MNNNILDIMALRDYVGIKDISDNDIKELDETISKKVRDRGYDSVDDNNIMSFSIVNNTDDMELIVAKVELKDVHYVYDSIEALTCNSYGIIDEATKIDIETRDVFTALPECMDYTEIEYNKYNKPEEFDAIVKAYRNTRYLNSFHDFIEFENITKDNIKAYESILIHSRGVHYQDRIDSVEYDITPGSDEYPLIGSISHYDENNMMTERLFIEYDGDEEDSNGEIKYIEAILFDPDKGYVCPVKSTEFRIETGLVYSSDVPEGDLTKCDYEDIGKFNSDTYVIKDINNY